MPTSFQSASLSAVKSWSTFSVSPRETSATRSAGCHFVFQKIAGRAHAAIEVLGLHGGEIEEHDDEAVIAQIFGTRDHGGLVPLPVGAGREAADGRLVQRRGHVDALKIEGGDLLLLAVFVDGEVALLEAADQFVRSWRRGRRRW